MSHQKFLGWRVRWLRTSFWEDLSDGKCVRWVKAGDWGLGDHWEGYCNILDEVKYPQD